MKADFTVNGKPAYKIYAKQLISTPKAILFDCEGDKVWLPKSSVKIVNEDTILVQDWAYNNNLKTATK